MTTQMNVDTKICALNNSYHNKKRRQGPIVVYSFIAVMLLAGPAISADEHGQGSIISSILKGVFLLTDLVFILGILGAFSLTTREEKEASEIVSREFGEMIRTRIKKGESVNGLLPFPHIGT